MELGQATEVIGVTAKAPLVNATNATVGTLFDTGQVFDLPLSGRNFQQLTVLTPGVSGDSIQGQRNRSNVYLTGGVSNSNLPDNGVSAAPPVNWIQEFRVQGVINDAEFGGASGGYVDLSTKAGTNRLRSVPKPGDPQQLDQPDFRQVPGDVFAGAECSIVGPRNVLNRPKSSCNFMARCIH